MNTIVAIIAYLIGDLRPIDVLLFVYVDVVYVAIWRAIKWLMKQDKGEKQ